MRILYSHRIQSHDGQGIHVEAMVTALRAAGHEVLVVGPSSYAASTLGSSNRALDTLRRRLPPALAELLELAYSLPAYARLRRAALSFRPDALYERYNLFFLAGLWLARTRRLPYLVEVNAPLADERARHGTLRLRALARRTEHAVWRGADRVLPVTGVLAALVAQAGVPPDRIRVTPNGIDPADFAPPASRPSTGPVRLGFVGFVRDWHGLDAVLAALAAHERARAPSDPALALDVVGDGPALPALRLQAAREGIAPLVTFHGLAPRDAIPSLVARFDVALQPRSVDYASPLKLFEYMAAARAVVAPDQPNIREVLAPEATALLFPPGDADAMWAQILRLAADPALRGRLGAAARAEVLAHRTWLGNARTAAALAEEVRRERG